MADRSPIAWIKEHMKLYASDPDKAHNWDSSHLGGPGVLPTLLLTTTGRKSGQARTLPTRLTAEGVGECSSKQRPHARNPRIPLSYRLHLPSNQARVP